MNDTDKASRYPSRGPFEFHFWKIKTKDVIKRVILWIILIVLVCIIVAMSLFYRFGTPSPDDLKDEKKKKRTSLKIEVCEAMHLLTEAGAPSNESLK